MRLEDVRWRLARADDWTGLREFCYPQDGVLVFREAFRRSLGRQEAGRARHLLGEWEGMILASGQLVRYGGVGELADLMVAVGWRGRGLGSALIGRLEAEAGVLGWWPLEVGVARENVRAWALYERLGYVVDREVRLASGDTAVVLRKER